MRYKWSKGQIKALTLQKIRLPDFQIKEAYVTSQLETYATGTPSPSFPRRHSLRRLQPSLRVLRLFALVRLLLPPTDNSIDGRRHHIVGLAVDGERDGIPGHDLDHPRHHLSDILVQRDDAARLVHQGDGRLPGRVLHDRLFVSDQAGVYQIYAANVKNYAVKLDTNCLTACSRENSLVTGLVPIMRVASNGLGPCDGSIHVNGTLSPILNEDDPTIR